MQIDTINLTGLDLTPYSVRSPGCHVSEVIRDLENTVLKPGERRKYDELSPSEQTRLTNHASVGWAWEEIIRQGLLRAGFCPADSAVSPGELVLDGIHGTPDWLRMDPYRVIEFKSTWRSSGRPLDDYWHWLVQIKAYCNLLCTATAELYVLYVNGNYRDSGPEYKGYLLEFTPTEIRDNWDMLKNHARSKGWVKGK